MSQQSHWTSLVAALGLLAGLSGCGSDDNDTGASASAATSNNPLVIVAERTSPEGALHYLHVLPDWPADGKLDFGNSIELGEPGVAHAEGDKFFHFRGPSGRLQRFTVDDKLKVQKQEQISFSDYGVATFDAEPIWAAPNLAYLVDEKTGQVIRFDPTALRIDGATPIGPSLKRDGIDGQLQLGLAANDRLFTTASWYNYKGKGVNAAVIAVFDQKNLASGPRLVEDPRSTYTVANGVWEDGDYVYVVSDAANAFAVLADPVAKTTVPQAVVRMRKNADTFDQSYLVDLQKVTGSPAIRMTWPMKGNKLLVNLWAPSIDPATVIKAGDDASFWNAKTWTYAVVDLAAGKSTLIAAIPPAGAESTKLLAVDDQNYLQVFRDDRSSLLYRVNADASVTQVLDLPKGANVQYLARLKPAATK